MPHNLRRTPSTRVMQRPVTCWSASRICWILTCGTPKERAEVVADLQKDNRLALMEARNRQIREDKYGTE